MGNCLDKIISVEIEEPEKKILKNSPKARTNFLETIPESELAKNFCIVVPDEVEFELSSSSSSSDLDEKDLEYMN